MECVLHISYRLEIKTWQVREAGKKYIRKKEVQERFRPELGLLVDMPKQQSVNTNDGNTDRKFFRHPEKTAEITGVEFNLIKCYYQVLSSGNYSRVHKL
ncbi:hypothetical protein AVEN_118866-1 [Araneus ventricosus]|uniref:Uncharacterized protein n=1 Tax=Araneus ventricosus TaxID=182803 RepID=A0A4Y2QZQ0_ARAVE|nr:hypothetical protein AVEN_195720-1 [Araneus ventricosus]GBN68609.1 hypothetical protein AVEN_118866-1 [Araneus ventricosus]